MGHLPLLSRRPSWQILHVRADEARNVPPYSGIPTPYIIYGRVHALRELADWAFGLSGLPELRVLTCSDPSHFDRQDGSNELYCRDENFKSLTTSSFRELRDNDFVLQDLLKCHRDMLTACAYDLFPQNQWC